MKKLLFDCGTRDATASTGLLVLRVAIGTMMLLGHGLAKWQKFGPNGGGEWKSPDIWPFNALAPNISLGCALAAEIGASALLILGLATRPAAFVLGFTMVVAAFFVHGQGTWFMSAHPSGSKELALLYLLAFVVLIITGAGRWSLDCAWYRESKRKRW